MRGTTAASSSPNIRVFLWQCRSTSSAYSYTFLYHQSYAISVLQSVVKYNSKETKHEQTVIALDDFHRCVIIRSLVELYALEMELPVVQILTLQRRSAGCFIKRPSSYRAVNTFHLGYKNQSVCAVSGTSLCLFLDKYKTHKYGVGRTYSCWMLNCWCIT